MNPPLKTAETDYPIHALLAQRYSPYAFAPKEVEPDKLRRCLEAARWAPSSYNEQPWSFLVARREEAEAFEGMLECLVEPNRVWARHAGVLLLSVVCPTFQRNGKPNRVAEHDIGLAAGNLTVQATVLGLAVHQMAGINPSVARQKYQIPETHHPLTAIAIGYASAPDQAASAELGDRDRSPRQRKPLAEFVFHGQWQQSAEL